MICIYTHKDLLDVMSLCYIIRNMKEPSLLNNLQVLLGVEFPSPSNTKKEVRNNHLFFIDLARVNLITTN